MKIALIVAARLAGGSVVSARHPRPRRARRHAPSSSRKASVALARLHAHAQAQTFDGGAA